ncbi:MAG TPA: glycine zipper domain-containing protein [Thermoanaerobaculia bacterium]|nr:glycine zipper domain-containing protein [Thermoanaerobaculia bacterium]
MKSHGFAPLIPALVLAALAACSPQQAQKPGAEEAPAASQTAQTAPSPSPAPETVAEADVRTHDELGAGREVAPAEPAPEPSPSAADLEAKERELARRERDLRAREARAAAAKPKPARVEAPAPAYSEPEATEAESPENPEIAEGPELGDDSDRGYDAEPEDQPEPERSPAATVPSGEHLAVELIGDLSSAGSSAGDTFRVRVARDIESDGEVAIPAGSEVHGLVSEAVSARARRGQPAKLTLKFTDLVLPDGETVPIHATLEELAASHPGRKAATVGGGAAAGAVLGRVLAGSGSRGKGTVIGALVGALAGAAIASHEQASEEIEIPAGTLFDLRLDSAIEIGGGAR